MSALAAAAVVYAGAGYEVFPLRGKLPFGNGPACEPRSPHYRPHQAIDCEHELCHGLYAATSDPGRVERWWARWPGANMGGRVPRSLVVMDVDPRHGGQARRDRRGGAQRAVPWATEDPRRPPHRGLPRAGIDELAAHLGPAGPADARVFTADKGGGMLRPSNFPITA